MADEHKTFLCEYPFQDGWWCFEIKATSHQEAVERLKAMPWATVKGEQFAKIKVPGGGFFARLFGW